MKYLILSALLPQFLCQYNADLGMKPDVTFNEDNDRFDLTALVQSQNKLYDHHTYNSEEEEDARKHIKRRNGLKILHKNGVIEDFGYHDTPSGNGGTAAEYKESLKKFIEMNSRRLIDRLHEGVSSGRRNIDSGKTDQPLDLEKEVLMHYAVPVQITVQGYLQAPLVL